MLLKADVLDDSVFDATLNDDQAEQEDHNGYDYELSNDLNNGVHLHSLIELVSGPLLRYKNEGDINSRNSEADLMEEEKRDII